MALLAAQWAAWSAALFFGGDPLARAASGAAIGAASGAAIGASSGASRDKKEKDRYVAELGQHNYDGFVALADCHYDKALELAAKGQQYKGPPLRRGRCLA